MALSREEQRRLEELEALLAEDDPHLAHTLRGTRPNPITGRRALVGGAGFLVGIALLVAGMQWHWTVSVVGFLVMLAAAAHLFGVVGHRGGPPDVDGDGAPSGGRDPQRGRLGDRPAGGRPTKQTPFMDKMEDRWRRRQQDL
ncbi:DUF3040 domain-containing protein [Aestuariimicrobium sp. p3-SID1156]|uniref:DUF3040 domain-containing protein n=1 Tax=Aestuariimicrobium sp. p3-SID1156 TaxID=2916038 RepID=UPI00223B76ED|nr:DUF3040 domain-containing protein [Aestuariimicrobium sp. p3-SID1156]MCT1458895.1 DUF3040 domain-containing protein [Aestuariimicrobium sp. p3-SID1156]